MAIQTIQLTCVITMYINSFLNNKINTVAFGSKKDSFAQSPAKEFYKTQRGDLARKMNIAALNQIKRPYKSSYPDATPEDLKILTDNTLEGSLKKVQWINPKDLKVYNLIKESEDEDGNINIRILDKDGKFIKKANIKPPTIFILDAFGYDWQAGEYRLSDTKFLDHGYLVSRFAQKNNPFAKYVYADINHTGGLLGALDYAIHRIESGKGKIDALNFSFGTTVENQYYNVLKGKNFDEYTDAVCEASKKGECEKFSKDDYDRLSRGILIVKRLKKLSELGVEVFVSSSNFTKDYFNLYLLNTPFHGVGSLSPNGKISDFTSSTIDSLTKEFELGEYETKEMPDGVNYTGIDGTDLEFDVNKKFKLKGKELSGRVLTQEEWDELEECIKIGPPGASSQLIYSYMKSGKVVPEEIYRWVNQITGPKNDVELYYDFRRYAPYTVDKDGLLQPYFPPVFGTSFAAPTRAAKYTLNKCMEGII